MGIWGKGNVNGSGRFDVGESGQLGAGMSIVNGVRGQESSMRQHPSPGTRQDCPAGEYVGQIGTQ